MSSTSPLLIKTIRARRVLPQLASSRQRHQLQGAKERRKTTQGHEDGENPWPNLRLPYDYLDFFQWIFGAAVHYLAMVWQRGFCRPLETPNTIQVRSFTICLYLISFERGDSVLLAMLWWNYYLCIVTDPGRVPPQWVHTNIIQYSSWQESILAQSIHFLRNLVCRKKKALKSTGWGIPDTAGNVRDTNHPEHITVRTVGREFCPPSSRYCIIQLRLRCTLRMGKAPTSPLRPCHV